jgi:hypothetical protein
MFIKFGLFFFVIRHPFWLFGMWLHPRILNLFSIFFVTKFSEILLWLIATVGVVSKKWNKNITLNLVPP